MIVNSNQKILVTLAVAQIVFWLVVFFEKNKSGLMNNLVGAISACIAFIAGFIALENMSKWGNENRIRKGLLFSGLGLVFWGIGGLVWAYYSFYLNIALPYPSVADIFYLPSVLLYSLGVINFARASGSDSLFKNKKVGMRNGFKIVIISVVSFYILVTIVRDGKLFDPEYSVIENFLNIAYPCIDFIGLTVAVLVSGSSFKYILVKYRIALVALTIGLVLMFISDSLINYYIIHGTYFNGCFSDFSFIVGTSVLIFGVLGFCNEKNKVFESKIHFFEFLKFK